MIARRQKNISNVTLLIKTALTLKELKKDFSNNVAGIGYLRT